MIAMASYRIGFRILVNIYITRPEHIALLRFSLIDIFKPKLYKRIKKNHKEYILITQQ